MRTGLYSPLLSTLDLAWEESSRAFTASVSRAGGGLVHTESDFTLNVLPGAPRINGVVSPEFTVENAAERIEAVLKIARQCGEDIRFKLGPSTQPANLAHRLEARGLKRSNTFKYMGLDLSRGLPEFSVPQGVRIYLVEDFTAFMEMPHPFYGRKASPRKRALVGAYAVLACENPRRLWVFVIEKHNHFAGAGVMFLHGEVVTGHDFAILKSLRRQGLGAALLSHMGRFAIQNGARWAVLNTSTEGMRFYPHFGFVHAGRVPTFLYSKALQAVDAGKGG